MTNSAVSGNNGEYDRLLRQRDVAFACAILAVALTIVILWRNFGVQYTELEKANQTVRRHRELLVENQKALTAVHSALLSTRQAVDELSQAKHGSP